MTDREMFEVGADGFCPFERRAMGMARSLCHSQFGITNEADIQDAVTEAWILAQARRGTPGTVAWNACLHIKCKRHIQESARSVTSPAPVRGKAPKHKRVSFRIILDSARHGANPAEIATFQIDFDEWMKRLPKRLRKFAKSFLKGLSTNEAAARFQVSPGRISQIRRELEDNWEEMFAEED